LISLWLCANPALALAFFKRFFNRRAPTDFFRDIFHSDILHRHSQNMNILTPELLIMAYQQGYFPMAEADGELYWHSPDPRAIIPLDAVRIGRTLRKTLAKGIFETRFNTAFRRVVEECSRREETWISEEIIESYSRLHELGFAHSVESWRDGELVGGLYGVALGGAFFGESMFSRQSDSSKVAFVRLVERLRAQGFILLDSQYLNDYIASFGGIEIPRAEYLSRLEAAVCLPCSFQLAAPRQRGRGETRDDDETLPLQSSVAFW
jgi:leucyl/phenylalanyl-tRNA--protein transferase